MIIGISGRIGSGKDTVGKIIQYLNGRNLFKEQMGYYPDFNNFENEFINWESFSKWEIKKYAGKLKQIASLLTGIPVEKFEDQEFKKTYLGKEWNKISNRQVTEDFVSSYHKMISVREFLQKLGTEAIRDGIHENAWVNALFADYKPIDRKEIEQSKDEWTEQIKGQEFIFPNWIITDTRFPNEAKAIKKRKGIIIRVKRPIELPIGYTTLEEYNKTLHPSETSLDDWNFDYVIENNGTIEELIGKVKTILIKENILK